MNNSIIRIRRATERIAAASGFPDSSFSAFEARVARITDIISRIISHAQLFVSCESIQLSQMTLI